MRGMRGMCGRQFVSGGWTEYCFGTDFGLVEYLATMQRHAEEHVKHAYGWRVRSHRTDWKRRSAGPPHEHAVRQPIHSLHQTALNLKKKEKKEKEKKKK